MSRDEDIPGPKDSVSSLEFLPGSSSVVLAASWDGHVRVYDLSRSSEHGSATPLAEDCLVLDIETRAPVLDACFLDESHLVTAGLDGILRCFDVEGNTTFKYPAHAPSAARCVRYAPRHDLLISGGWDGALVFGRVQSPNGALGGSSGSGGGDDTTSTQLLKPDLHRHDVGGKIFAMSLTAAHLVVGLSQRAIHVYALADLRAVCAGTLAPAAFKPLQVRESSLKFMTRTLACTPSGEGFITTSIEGRVAVDFFATERQHDKYAFKCHRQPAQPAADGSGEVEDVVHPVHAVCFHPVHGTFATAGSDGVVSMWDVRAKKRVKQWASCGQSINALAFASDGRTLVMGIGGDDGADAEHPAAGILVRLLADSDGKAKAVDK